MIMILWNMVDLGNDIQKPRVGNEEIRLPRFDA